MSIHDKRYMSTRPQPPPLPDAQRVSTSWVWAVGIVAALFVIGIFVFGAASRNNTTAGNPSTGNPSARMGTTGRADAPAPTQAPRGEHR